jgi:hypothetical protein
VITLALSFKPWTMPLENRIFALNEFNMNSQRERSNRPAFFIGSIQNIAFADILDQGTGLPMPAR